jgi:hypothetical protein
MKAWLPPAVIAAIMLFAAVLNIIASRRSHGESSESNLLARFSGKRQQVKSLQEANTRLTADLAESNRGKSAAINERDGLQNRLSELTVRLGTAEANHTLKIDELNNKLDAKIEEVKTAKRETETANLRADTEAQDKRFTRELKERAENQLANLSWAEKMIADQAKDIAAHVIITSVKPGSLKLTDAPRCVTLGLRIRNESVFDITIRAANLTGRLFFQSTALNDPATILLDATRLPIENLKPMQSEMLVILQPLWKSEAETISEADMHTRFWLGNLNIPISVENVPQQIETKSLRIRAEVEHVSLKDFFGDTANENQRLTRQQLRQRIDALPPAERAKATEAALKQYGESLYQDDPPEK